MLHFFKKKTLQSVFTVTAPIDGILMSLSDVSDPVFAQKLIGDGFAIVPDKNANTIYAPVSGKVASLPETRQAVLIDTTDEMQVLVHVGVDTIDLLGNGFYAYTSRDKKVKQGQKLLRFSRELMKQKGLDSTVMVIFSKGENPHLLMDYGSPVSQGEVLMRERIVEK
ncbi:PTS glucose transporter subunit IIA [uncultured Lactobacillus sp.]|uniref:PTS sugar transporter subunit IIA n=1 Tax=uncultured Lactobacillus sp. TaxID=153152 RepID=UPI0026091F88|nr:PTS glucose transporter subunit IIA [uncultured Lactobacillus sp.]